MRFNNLTAERREAVLEITISRPDKLNALNRKTLAELQQAVDQAAGDAGIRAVILTGSGDKAFVAGADIGEIGRLGALQARAFSAAGQRLMRAIETCGKPVIAAVKGYALGGGLELALACHLRIASDNARLGVPEITLGIMPGFGGTQRLVRLLGRGRALYMALLGDPIDAATALDYGLVHAVCTSDELLGKARELAGRCAASAPIALRHIIEAVQQGQDLPLQDALALETQLFALCCDSGDMLEGTAAFLEKRRPQFSGK